MSKQTIAQKKANESFEKGHIRKKKKSHIKMGILLSAPLAAISYICRYMLVGYDFTSFVCNCLIFVILFYACIPAVGRIFPGFARISIRLMTVGLIVLSVLFVSTEYYIYEASLGNPDDSADYLIVLGAKVRGNTPSVSLQDRIDSAYTYLCAHPDVIAVVSGGQGADETMTEAWCMYDNLVQMGISRDRIWMEDMAATTDENLRFSLNLIEEKTGIRPQKIAVLSSEYHLLRAKLMTEKLGVVFVGVPAHTSRIGQRINHSMREFAGIWHFLLLGN